MFEEQLQHFAELTLSDSIHFGAPLYWNENDAPTTIQIPEYPHVFYCTDLYLMEPPSAIERTIDSLGVTGNPYIVVPIEEIQFRDQPTVMIHLQDVCIMLGHALTVGSEDADWIFRGPRLRVSEAVRTYQDAARRLRLPNLDAVIACRPSVVEQPKQSVHNIFNRSTIPVIRPISTATVQNDGPHQSQLERGKGATFYVSADGWEDIQWWLNYRYHVPQMNVIPSWYKEPA